MSLTNILVFSFLSLLAGWLLPVRWRLWFLLVVSLLAVYWLQPSSSIRNLDFWLATASIGLTLITWAIVQENIANSRKQNLVGLVIIAVLILAVGANRYLGEFCCLTPTRPPQISLVLMAVLMIGGITWSIYRFLPANRRLAGAAIILIIGLFIILKLEPVGVATSGGLRRLQKQDASLASITDIAWLGFSYLAFRLIHVLRDFQNQRLPNFRIDEFVTYALFYPSLPAGPIDRSQRFIQTDLQKAKVILSPERLLGIQRVLLGCFKKFVIADSLALIALSPQNAAQVSSTFWMWILLYAFALRIYFDFSGYTDIAIGIGLLVGIRLPENFASPYLKTNLTAFWNSWHITLAQWFRSYVFNPLTRNLRSRPDPIPTWLIILIGQMLTMLLIGLWHGITWGFAIWGLWHGIGLFIHNRWSDWSRPRLAGKEEQPLRKKALGFGGWFITFNYVTLGWVWFAVPNVNNAIQVFQKLLGY
jgi:alginate O-acetyltransferase complex protein AlgI